MSAVTPSLMLAWRLEGRRALVAGGGPIAAGRVDLLLQAGAEVFLVAPEITDGLAELAELEVIRWAPRTLRRADVDGAELVCTAIDDDEASDAAVAWCREAGVPVNAADRPDQCDFWFPAVFREGPVQVAVSTNGQSPGAASRLKRLLRSVLPAEAPVAIERLGRWRAGLKQRVARSAERMRIAGQQARLPWPEAARIGEEPRERGRLALVGAGPGDPSLLTARALDALAAADLILADRLVPAGLLERLDGEVRIARKLPGRAQAGQEELYRWIEEGVAAGKQVVRLKCGDPFVFGRGQEELRRFRDQGIEVDVIPGVTSAFAAPLSVGIPVTHRGLADRVTVITGTGAGGSSVAPPDFDPAGTLIWLMGVGSLDELAVSLIRDHGYPTNWPVAVVERATHPGQRAVRAPLHAIARVVRDQGLKAPAAIVMGSVVRQAESAAFEVDLEDTVEVRVAG